MAPDRNHSTGPQPQVVNTTTAQDHNHNAGPQSHRRTPASGAGPQPKHRTTTAQDHNHNAGPQPQRRTTATAQGYNRNAGPQTQHYKTRATWIPIAQEHCHATTLQLHWQKLRHRRRQHHSTTSMTTTTKVAATPTVTHRTSPHQRHLPYNTHYHQLHRRLHASLLQYGCALGRLPQ